VQAVPVERALPPSSSLIGKRRSTSLRPAFAESLQGWALVLPAVALLAAFTHWPTLQTIWTSLHTAAVPHHPSRFAPFANLNTLWADPVFWQALRNNLIYGGCTIPAAMALSLTMALAVDRHIPGRGFLRLAYFTPTILPMIAVANIWLYFFTPGYGLIDTVLAPFGLGDLNWLGTASTALPAVIAIAVWKQAGFYMIFYLAALQSLPPDLREAAALEGSSRWNFFRRVVWPLLMPTTLFVFINAAIDAFRLVDQIVVLTRGGPDNATTILLYYIYEVGFQYWDSNYAALLTVVLLLILAAIAALQFGVLARRVHYR
jgi:sn-glycerol 3-phosphate transport system permease protein